MPRYTVQECKKLLKEYIYKGKTTEFIHLYKAFDTHDHSDAYNFASHTLLGFACTHEEAGDVIDYLLDTVRVDVDATDGKERTALHLAVDHCNTSFIRKLIAHDANPNIKDYKGDTSLHYFAHGSDNTEVVFELLLRAGGDLSLQNNNGAIPLHAAAKYSLSSLHAIVSKGVEDSIDTPDNNGDTPLHYAATSESGYACTYLMMLGARADIANNAGEVAAVTADDWDYHGKDHQAILTFNADDFDITASEFASAAIAGEYDELSDSF